MVTRHGDEDRVRPVVSGCELLNPWHPWQPLAGGKKAQEQSLDPGGRPHAFFPPATGHPWQSRSRQKRGRGVSGPSGVLVKTPLAPLAPLAAYFTLLQTIILILLYNIEKSSKNMMFEKEGILIEGPISPFFQFQGVRPPPAKVCQGLKTIP